MGITTTQAVQADQVTQLEGLHEARNGAWLEYDAATTRVAQLLLDARERRLAPPDALETAKRARDAARDVFLHADHEWRHAANALDAGTRGSFTTELPL